MTTKFLTTGGRDGNFSNGTQVIFARSLAADNLLPSMSLKTNATKEIISSRLDINDVNLLGSELLTKSKLNFTEVSTPSPPPSNQISLYGKTGGKMFIQNDLGVETELVTGGTSAVGWAFSAAITGAVASGGVRFNNAVSANVSELCVSQVNSLGSNQRPLLFSLQDGDQIYLTDGANNSKLFTLTGSVVDFTTWFCLPVSLESQNVAPNYSAGDDILITFIPQANNLQTSYDVSTSPQLTTSAAQGPLVIKNGQADDNGKKQLQVKIALM